MKNKLLLASILGVFMIVGMVGLTSAWAGSWKSINLVEKDPVTWTPIVDGMKGRLSIGTYIATVWVPHNYGKYTVSTKTYVVRNSFSFSSSNLVPYEQYTLIYYGDEEHNDVFPYATCIGTRTASYSGRLSVSGYIDKPFVAPVGGDMLRDNVAQKIWVVPSSDVDCDAGEMTSWNPSTYLFEEKVI